MRYYILIFLFALLSCQNEKAFQKAVLKPSKIDSLGTEAEVEALIHQIDSHYKYFKLQKIEKFYSRYNQKSDSLIRFVAAKNGINKALYKNDFDNNGYLDLLVIGDHKYCDLDTLSCQYDTFVVMNFGSDSLNLKPLVRSHHMLIAPQIITENDQTLINIHEVKYTFNHNESKAIIITTPLVYKFENFIEYNKASARQKIEKLEFAAGPCFGTCPMFQIIIEKNRNAYFIAEHFNFNATDENYDKEEGTFKTTIIKEDYNKIIDLLNYINFSTLEDEYSVMYTDAPSATLRITYNGGKVKNIYDYGKTGTFGLKAVYNLFNELRFNQEWKPIKEPEGVRIKRF